MNKFITWWIGISFATFVGLSLVGLIPKKAGDLENMLISSLMYHDVKAVEATPTISESTQEAELHEAPIRISIPSVKIDFVIKEPSDTSNAVLDDALTEGIVHYPGSGLLGEARTMLLFGHSSHLKHVRNPAYRALTGVDKVAPGDSVIVYGEKNEYVYAVTSVHLADKYEELVEFETGQHELTISTCDTFGKKDDRYIVKATFIERRPIERVEANIVTQ
jgi:LPXTG-site transpeptidase (sortase) family protein